MVNPKTSLANDWSASFKNVVCVEYACFYNGGARGVMVIVVGNGQD